MCCKRWGREPWLRTKAPLTKSMSKHFSQWIWVFFLCSDLVIDCPSQWIICVHHLVNLHRCRMYVRTSHFIPIFSEWIISSHFVLKYYLDAKCHLPFINLCCSNLIFYWTKDVMCQTIWNAMTGLIVNYIGLNLLHEKILEAMGTSLAGKFLYQISLINYGCAHKQQNN